MKEIRVKDREEVMSIVIEKMPSGIEIDDLEQRNENCSFTAELTCSSAATDGPGGNGPAPPSCGL